MRIDKKEVSISLEFYHGKQDPENGIFEGGVKEPEKLDELTIDIREGETFDLENEQFTKTGKYEIQFQGSNKAYRELAKYLLAITEYQTEDPAYHDHFDDILNSEDQKFVDLVIYKPKNWWYLESSLFSNSDRNSVEPIFWKDKPIY